MFESTSPTLIAPSFTTLDPEEHFGVRDSAGTERAHRKRDNVVGNARGGPGWR